MRSKFAVLAILTVMSSSVFAQSESFLLRLKLTPETSITVDTKAESHSSISGAMEVESNQTVTTKAIFEFSKFDGDWMNASTQSTEVKLESDGNLPGIEPESYIEKLKGVKSKMQINLRGFIQNLTISGDPEVTGMMAIDPSSQMGFMGIEFPEAEIQVGKNWVIERDLKFLEVADAMLTAENGKLKTDFKLVSVETINGQQIATIESVSDINISVSAMGQAGKSTSKIKSTALFNITTGMYTSVKTTTTSTVDLGMIVVDSKLNSTSTIAKN